MASFKFKRIWGALFPRCAPKRSDLPSDPFEEKYEAINNILFNAWDPLQLRTYGPKGEYYSYVEPIHRLLSEGALSEEIAEELRQIEIHFMGRPERPIDELLPVAVKLKALA